MNRMYVNILEGCLYVWGNLLLDFMYGDYLGFVIDLFYN